MAVVLSLRTPLSVEDAKKCLREAVLKLGGTESLARLIIAQSDLETGTWKSVWNHNLGNIRGDYKGATTSIPGATEYDSQGKLVVVPEGFRAYPDFASGAEDKLKQLIRNFPKAWAATDLTSYVDGLWRGRLGSYFGVPPKDPYGVEGRKARDRYEAGMKARYDRLFAGDLNSSPPATSPPPLRELASLDPLNHGGIDPRGSPPATSPPPALDVSSLPTLRKGSSGAHVAIWQKLLGQRATGVMDAPTLEATRVYQIANSLVPDREVGPKTWKVALS